jgi:hypothetical protein
MYTHLIYGFSLLSSSATYAALAVRQAGRQAFSQAGRWGNSKDNSRKSRSLVEINTLAAKKRRHLSLAPKRRQNIYLASGRVFAKCRNEPIRRFENER